LLYDVEADVADTSRVARPESGRIAHILEQNSSELLDDWVAAQSGVLSARGSISANELRSQSREFIALLQRAAANSPAGLNEPAWQEVRGFLGDLSRSRAIRGFSPSETATFVFSLKEPLFSRLREAAGSDADLLATDIWNATLMLDELGLYTTEVYQKSREELITRQQRDLLELSTPVVKLWEGILALPMVGTLDSSRTQVAMESLLQRIVETGSDVAILDITGVPTVDTLTAQHLLKTVNAVHLMGAECIISGIRPQIAQTIVHLGVDLTGVITKSSLADAFRTALQRTGRSLIRSTTPNSEAGPRAGA
ncbi:MAG TPA: STAS domain-containing protein, partial [Gemmatimonadaceae bacterium]|nr:STAS domain-containing protein [Gemmatimonadaceae bacterium]